MRFIALLLVFLIPNIGFSQETLNEVKPSNTTDQVIMISYQINLHNKDIKKYETQMAKIREIGYRIASQTDDARPFTFQFIKDSSVNAFALPGGFIFITEGMIKLGLEDDEWAHLLGHEIAHVVKDHHARKNSFSFARWGMIMAGLAAAVYGNYQLNKNSDNQYTNQAMEERRAQYHNLFTVAFAGPAILNSLYSLKYSREFEKEADLYGRKYAAAAGYTPKGSEALFEKLSKSDHHHIDHMWRSHPQMLDRTFAASLSEEKIIEKDFSLDIQKAKVQAQNTLFQYAKYYSNNNKSYINSSVLVILHLTKLIIEIDKNSDTSRQVLQLAFEQLIIMQALGKPWNAWGLFHQLYKEVDPQNKNCLFLEEKAKDQYKDLTNALLENRAGIPVCELLIKNFPEHPELFRIYFSLAKSLYQNRTYNKIPENFIKACELPHTELEAKELSKFGIKFIKVCKYPFQLFQMTEALKDSEFSAEAKKSYLKMVENCETLKEVIKILEQESLKEIFIEKTSIKENAIKETFVKAKLKEKQNLKSEAYRYYHEIIIYGDDSPYVALAEAALKTLGFE